jgi:hypothetical protein
MSAQDITAYKGILAKDDLPDRMGTQVRRILEQISRC